MAGHRPKTSTAGSVGRRAEVLGVLKDAERPVSIAEIAQQLDIHVNTVRFHLDTLVETRQVERVAARHRTPGRPPQLFRAVRRMDPTGPRQFQLLAEVLADALGQDVDPGERAVAAGRSLGHRLAQSTSAVRARREPVRRLATLLDDLGFSPRLTTARARGGTSQIELRSCPFLEVATRQPQVACPVHLGMMQGALEAWDSTTTVDSLEPFVEPDLCVARLRARGS